MNVRLLRELARFAPAYAETVAVAGKVMACPWHALCALFQQFAVVLQTLFAILHSDSTTEGHGNFCCQSLLQRQVHGCLGFFCMVGFFWLERLFSFQLAHFHVPCVFGLGRASGFAC